MSTKKRTKRIAKKMGLRMKHGIGETPAKRDSMYSTRRKYGGGLSA